MGDLGIKIRTGTFLAVQRLRLLAPNEGDLGLIPGQGTRSPLQGWSKIPRAAAKTQHSQVNKKINIKINEKKKKKQPLLIWYLLYATRHFLSLILCKMIVIPVLQMWKMKVKEVKSQVRHVISSESRRQAPACLRWANSPGFCCPLAPQNLSFPIWRQPGVMVQIEDL